MGRFPFVTLRALAEHDRVEAVMGAPLRGAGLGVPSFGISHYRYRVLYWFNRPFSAASLGSSHRVTH